MRAIVLFSDSIVANHAQKLVDRKYSILLEESNKLNTTDLVFSQICLREYALMRRFWQRNNRNGPILAGFWMAFQGAENLSNVLSEKYIMEFVYI